MADKPKLRMILKPRKTYHIHRHVDGKWEFWMFVRAVSEKQAAANVWWRNKEVPRSSIRAIEGEIPEAVDLRPWIKSPDLESS